MRQRFHAPMAILVVCSVMVFPEQEKAVESASELPPPECVRMLRDARMALEQEKRAEGLELLRRAAETFPHELIPILELWRFHRLFGLPEEEVRSLRDLLIRRLAEPDSALPPGVLKFLVDGAGEEELPLILQGVSARLEVSPENPELIDAVARLQYRLEMPEAARASLGRLLSVRATDDVRWRCVDLDIALERWEDAAGLLEEMMKGDDPTPWTRITYTDIMGKLGRYDKVMEQIEFLDSEGQILREMINDILLEAGWNLRDAGKDHEAEEVFRRVLSSDPRHPEAQAAILYLYSSEEERVGHAAALKATWEEEEDPYRLLEEAGNLLAAGNAQEAVDLLERVVAEIPDSEIAWFNLGLAAFKLERWEIAEQALSTTTRINPERAEAFFNRGGALQKLGRCHEAIDDLKQALTLQPEMAQAYYYLYECHRMLGNKEEAKEALRRYNER